MNIFERLTEGLSNWTSNRKKTDREPKSPTQQDFEFSDDDHALYNPKTGFIYTFPILVEWIKKNGVQQDDKTAYTVFPYCFTIHADSIEVCKITGEHSLSRVALVSKHGFFRPYPNQHKELLPEFGIFFDRYVKTKSRNGRPGQRIYGTYLKEIDEITPEDFPAIRQLLLDRGTNPADLRFTPISLRRCEIFNQFRTYCTFVHEEEVRLEEERKQQAAEAEKEAKRLEEKKKFAELNEQLNARNAEKLARQLKHQKMLEEHKAAKAEKEALKIEHENEIVANKAERKTRRLKHKQSVTEAQARREAHQEEMEFHRQRREHRQRLVSAITALIAAESNEAIASQPIVQQAAFFLIRMTEEVLIFEDKREDEEHYTYYITDGFALNVHPLSDEQFSLVVKAFTLCADTFPPMVIKILNEETIRRAAFS